MRARVWILLFLLVLVKQAESEVTGTIKFYSSTENSSSGIVTAYKSGSYLPICDDYFDDKDARVVCRSFLNLTNASSTAFSFRYYPRQNCPRVYNYNFSYDDMNCTGAENSITACVSQSQKHNCLSNECVYMECKLGNATQSTNDTYPRLNLTVTNLLSASMNGVNGYVCDDQFDANAARVACKTLYGENYTYDEFSIGQQCQVEIYLTFLYDNVYCTGEEEKLSDCRSNQYGSNDCYSNECILLTCKEMSQYIAHSEVNHYAKESKKGIIVFVVLTCIFFFIILAVILRMRYLKKLKSEAKTQQTVEKMRNDKFFENAGQKNDWKYFEDDRKDNPDSLKNATNARPNLNNIQQVEPNAFNSRNYPTANSQQRREMEQQLYPSAQQQPFQDENELRADQSPQINPHFQEQAQRQSQNSQQIVNQGSTSTNYNQQDNNNYDRLSIGIDDQDD